MKIEERSVKNYINKIIKMFGERPNGKYHKWLLDNGKEIKCKKLKGEKLNYVNGLITLIKRFSNPNFPRNKECYYNAFLLSEFSHGRINYIEGLSWDLIPFEHAWCKIDDIYFDPTILFNNRFKEDILYFGIELSNKEMHEYMYDIKRQEVTSGLINMFRSKYLKDLEKVKIN